MNTTKIGFIVLIKGTSCLQALVPIFDSVESVNKYISNYNSAFQNVQLEVVSMIPTLVDAKYKLLSLK